MYVNKTTNPNEIKDNKGLHYYLDLTKDFKSSFKPFTIIKCNGFNIIDESQSNPVGAKARFGEFLMTKLNNYKEIVYVQPRRGFAGISLSYLCQMYNKNLTLVMPASKKSSDHQRLCIEYGAKPLFLRIAAMPNANQIAKRYAEQEGAFFIPLGLQHEYVVAGAVRSIYDYFKDKEHPKRMWCVISTGVLSRSLQIALPNTKFHNVAVARNIQQGELGRAMFHSYHKRFESVSDYVPKEFDCEPSYDSKGYHYMMKYGREGDWFFNVAGDAPKPTLKWEDVDSYRDWGDFKDFKRVII